jgi:hypothetical protein
LSSNSIRILSSTSKVGERIAGACFPLVSRLFRLDELPTQQLADPPGSHVDDLRSHQPARAHLGQHRDGDGLGPQEAGRALDRRVDDFEAVLL